MRKQNKDREKDRARSRDQRRKAKNQLRQYHSRPSPGVSYSNPSQLLPSSFLNQSNLAGIGGSVISRGQTSEPSGPGANKLILTMEKIARGQYKSLVGMNNSIITLRLDQRSQKEFMQCYQEVCIELNVKHLVLSNNDISSFRIFETIENLMTINLRNNRLKEFLQEDVVSKLPHLETLVMSENLIATLPEKSLTILSNKLRKLDLSSNCLTSLPSYITVLENLVKLDVSKNQISSLPQELLQWKLVENFHTSGLHFPPLGAKPHTHSSISGELLLRGNRFKEPHQRHFDSKGLSHLREYMAHTYAGQAHQTHHTSHLATLGGKGNTTSNLHIGSPYYPMSLRDYLKVVIVGHDGSGKSVIAMALKQFHQVNKRSEPHGFKWQADEEAVVITPEFRNETLENANTSYERSSVPIPHLKINLWDFMEKDVYQSSMDIFYSRHALHIVVWNVARASASHYAGQPAYHEVEYWINLIQARAPGSTTLIVATHTDLLSSERADYLINGCREYIGYQEVKRMSALQSEIDRCENEKEKFYLQQMLFERPCVVLDDIVRLTYANEEITGGLDLVTQIILLSHSSSLLAGCTLLPRANLHDQLYDDVKKALDMLRHDCNFACTIGDINTVIEKQRAGAPVFDFEDASDADKPLELDDDTLRDALTYWMQAGEIVYLYDPNLFETMEMQDEDEGEEISSASSKLTSQLVRTSLAGSTIHSETPPYSFSLEDRISTAQHSLVDGVEMAKDFSPSVAGVDDGSSCASSFPNLTVSDMVFISPNRFKKALLGILNKDPKAHIGELQRAPLQAERQGSDETHSIPAPLDYRNGLVNWSTLRILLKESSMCLLSSPYVSGNFFSENEVEKILTFLREALVYLEVLIPVRTDAPENNIGERAFDMPETQQLLYVFPALLAEVDPHSYDVPQFAPSGLIKLEKSFELPKFAPIALIPKIMAKLFSRTSRRQQDFQVDETASSSSVDINKDKCQCFQTCFVQTIGERTLWVYLDHYNSSSPDTGLISPVSPSSVKHHYAYSMASQSFDSSVSYTLRIVVFDYLFSVQQGVSELHDIQDIVIDVLQSYKGLGKVNIISYCPVCLMQQLPYSSSTFTCCGVISEEVERKVMQELNNLVEACITDQYNNEPESDIYAQFQLWEARKESICTNKCKFKADFYIPLPKDIIDHKTSYCVAHEIELYLSAYYSDILGDCSDFDSSPCSGASYSPSICHPNEVSSMNSPIKPIVHLGSQCDRIGLALVKVACLKCDQDALCKLEQFRTSAITSSKLVSASREFELSGISFHTLIDDQISYFVYTMQPRNFNHKQDAWFLVKVGEEHFLYWYDHTFSNELSILLLSLVCGLNFTMKQWFTLNLADVQRDRAPQFSVAIDLAGIALEGAVLAYIGGHVHTQAPKTSGMLQHALSSESTHYLANSTTSPGGLAAEGMQDGVVSKDISFVLGRVFRYSQCYKVQQGDDSFELSYSYYLVNSYAGNPKPGTPVFRTHDDKLIGIVATYDINAEEPTVQNVFAVVPIDFFFLLSG